MSGRTAASELKSQYPLSRLRVARGRELPFSGGLRCEASEILARATHFEGLVDDIPVAIDRYANRDLDVAAYRVADVR